MPFHKIIQRFSVFAILLAFLAQHPATARADDDSDVVDRFKIFKDGDALLVPVTLEGKTYQFVVDTGSAVTVFDRTLLHGDPLEKTGIATANDEVSVPMFAVPKATLGKHNLRDSMLSVVGLDLANLRNVSGHDLYGIVGMDFLINWVVQIRFDDGELLLRRTVGEASKMQPVPIVFDEYGLPYVNANIPNYRDIEFLLDTGDMGLDSGELVPQLSRDLLQRGEMNVVGTSKFESASGTGEMHLYQDKSLVLCNHQVTNPIFGEGKFNSLGLNYLSRYQVTLDFVGKKMYLSEGKAFNKIDKRKLSGMNLIHVDGKTIVHSIDTDGAAEEAGIHAGDIIVNIDNQKTDQMRMHEIGLIFCQPNANLHITATRSGKEYETTLNLK